MGDTVVLTSEPRDAWNGRDILAAHALTGLLAAQKDAPSKDPLTVVEMFAKSAYALADAMIEERDRGSSAT